MSKAKTRRQTGLKVLRSLFILICLGGFLYQALEFMELYWTYPTVVDIQKSEPSEFEIPAFTICNPIGYNFTTICEGFDVRPCLPSTLNKYISKEICFDPYSNFDACCFDGKVPKDFQAIMFNIFSEAVYVKAEDHDKLRVPLKNYFKCEIDFFGEKQECNIENVMGPFYSREELPQYCYSIYSLWGQPNKQRERIRKGAIMKLRFFLNASKSIERDFAKIRPRYNVPSTPSVQIAVHSPYFLPSPYLEGTNFLGGRAYELRISTEQNHLLPYPYQSNCTDYLKIWKARGGKAPINQVGMINECRMNEFNNAYGCVPVTVDYPHNYSICTGCRNTCNYTINEDECSHLAENYNQPCDSLSYNVFKTDKLISLPYKMKAGSLKNEKEVILKIPNYECMNSFMWSVEVLEIFSVIGGYLGMWLGISLVTVYDFIGTMIGIATRYGKKWKDKMKLSKKDARYQSFQRPAFSRDNFVM